MNSLTALLPELLPQAIHWAQTTETKVITEGYHLSASMQQDAYHLGVKQPHKIAIWEVDPFPLPEPPELRRAATMMGLLGANTAGLTLGYAILIKPGLFSRRLISHECRHVFQYEQAGSIAAFLPLYLQSVITYGYTDSPYEQDARQHELL